MAKVSDLMSPNPCSCSPDDTLDVAGWLMWDRDVGVVPVVDRDRKVVGVITDRDLAMALVLRNRSPNRVRVAESMTATVATCSPGDDLNAAEQLMADRQVRRIPVVDDEGRLVGLLSLNDLARNVAPRGRHGVPADDLARTLEAVGRPRRAKGELAAKAG